MFKILEILYNNKKIKQVHHKNDFENFENFIFNNYILF